MIESTVLWFQWLVRQYIVGSLRVSLEQHTGEILTGSRRIHHFVTAKYMCVQVKRRLI